MAFLLEVLSKVIVFSETVQKLYTN